MLADKEKNKQRGAAELLAGIVCGESSSLRLLKNDDIDVGTACKHWPMERQSKFWDWFKPHVKKLFSQTNNDMVSIWTSFFEVCPQCG